MWSVFYEKPFYKSQEGLRSKHHAHVLLFDGTCVSRFLTGLFSTSSEGDKFSTRDKSILVTLGRFSPSFKHVRASRFRIRFVISQSFLRRPQKFAIIRYFVLYESYTGKHCGKVFIFINYYSLVVCTSLPDVLHLSSI